MCDCNIFQLRLCRIYCAFTTLSIWHCGSSKKFSISQTVDIGQKFEKWPKFKISKCDFQTEFFWFSIMFVILCLMLPCTELNCRSGNINFVWVRHDCKKVLKVEKIVDRHYGKNCDFCIFDIHFVHGFKYGKLCVIVIFFNWVYAEFIGL